MTDHLTETSGDYPIHAVVRSRNLSAATKLIAENAACIDEKNRLGDTPLHLACGDDCVEIVRFLLDHGADKEAVDGSGFKPIHRAAEGGHLCSVQLLVSAGVDPDSLTTQGVSALQLVRRPDQSLADAAVFGWLLAHGAVYDLYTAVANGMTHVVAAMLNAEPTSWRDRPRACRAIVKACSIFYLESNNSLIKKRRDLARLLLDHGANPNEVSDGVSPLLVSIRNNDLQLTELLIKCGADVNLIVDNCSPIQMAKKTGDTNIIDLLLVNGASDDGIIDSCQYPF